LVLFLDVLLALIYYSLVDMNEVKNGFVDHFNLGKTFSRGSRLRNVRFSRQYPRTRRPLTKFENRPDFDDFTEIISRDEENRNLLTIAFNHWKILLQAK